MHLDIAKDVLCNIINFSATLLAPKLSLRYPKIMFRIHRASIKNRIKPDYRMCHEDLQNTALYTGTIRVEEKSLKRNGRF